MQHADAWSPVAALVGERYPVKVLDFESWTFDERVAEIDAAARDRAVIGYSMGGRLLLHAAVRSPGGFAAIATIGAGAGIEDPDARRRRAEADEALATWIESQPIEEVVARWERNPVFASQSPELIDAQRPGRLDHEPAQLATLLRSAGQASQVPIWDQLPSLQMPLLALAGERDMGYRAAADRMASLVGDGETDVIPNAGHAAHLENPEATAAEILAWLNRVLT